MKYTLEQLRDYDRSDTDAMLDWAADEIERLLAKNAALNAQFRNIGIATYLDRMREQAEEIERLQAIVDRLLKEIEFATHKLTCVSIERECKGVPEIVRVCDHQAIGILQEAAEKARTT